MSDLELLRTFRSELGELEPERQARLRVRVLAVLDEDDRPGRSVRARAVDRTERAEPEATIVELRPVAGPMRRRRGERGRRVAFAAAAAVAAVALVAGALAVVTSDRGADVVTHLGAPDPVTLRDLAEASRRQPDQPLGDGQYLYTRERYVLGPDATVEASQQDVVSVFERETWLDRDGLGRLVNHDRVTLRRTGETIRVEPPDGEQVITSPEPFGLFSYGELRSLPADPTELEARLLAGRPHGVPASDYLLSVAAHLLQPAVVPPATRGALYEVLAAHGVPVVPTATTWNGRPGVGLVGRSRSGAILRLIVDPETGALLGSIAYRPDGQPPTASNVDEWREIIDQRVVGGIDATS